MHLRCSRKVCEMPRKSIFFSSRKKFNAGKAANFPLSIRCVHNFILALNASMPSDTFKKFFSFPCIQLLCWFTLLKKPAKKSNLAIHSLSLKRSTNLCFCSFKKLLISFCRLGTHSSTFPRDNQRMLEWNRSPLCSASISSHNT